MKTKRNFNIGEYWYADRTGDSKSFWLFLIVAITYKNKRRYALGLKCSPVTRKPIAGDISFEYPHTWWFDNNGEAPVCYNSQDDDKFILSKREGVMK